MTQQQFLEEYTSLPEEAQRQVDDFVAFLRQRYKAVAPAEQSPEMDVEADAFIGMWRDREDFEDSTAWVRRVRNTEWGEIL